MQTKEPQLASQSSLLSQPPSISVVGVASQRQESVSVDNSIPHRGLCMSLCLFLKWFFFYSICMPVSLHPLNLNCNAILEMSTLTNQLGLSITFYLIPLPAAPSPVALIIFWKYCIHFTFFLYVLTCSMKIGTPPSCEQLCLQNRCQSLIYSYSSINACWMNIWENENITWYPGDKNLGLFHHLIGNIIHWLRTWTPCCGFPAH